ncbi:hypothetical protein LWI28_012654 [Acer negundo]|uniref:MSP domain-containing protein n=1 Tax=Acer negundo TaxID=4023 RepID=A0AAD5JKF9_ACENE|nr:hypothetical protein LWI28_012654 [Acer negundo]
MQSSSREKLRMRPTPRNHHHHHYHHHQSLCLDSFFFLFSKRSKYRVMAKQLLEIQPLELNFTFEVKKQSECMIQLGNKSDEYVAFKVKTTSPKKYCVRPNIGIIKPKATYDFTVIMQAQKEAPLDLLCKDKFLIQCTVVPFGTTDKDISSEMFAKDKETGKYVEEKKLRVVLISPPQSPVLLSGNEELKQDSSNETSFQKDRVLSELENVPPGDSLADDVEVIKTAKDTYELRAAKEVQDFETSKDTDELSTAAKDVEELQPAKDSMELKLAKDYEELKLKLNAMESQLREAERTITKLTEEKSLTTREKDSLKHELEVLRRKNNVRKIQTGFPLLYVCMVAIISLVLGYLSRS